MTPPQDRRLESRTPANRRALVLAGGLVLACVIADDSANGLRIVLDRSHTLRGAVVVIELDAGIAHEAQTSWSKGKEAGLKRTGRTALRGLVPARLIPARDAWLRVEGVR